LLTYPAGQNHLIQFKLKKIPICRMGEKKYLNNEYRTPNIECRSLDYFVIPYSSFSIRNSILVLPDCQHQNDALTARTRLVPGAEIPEE
jgi:hypothetical protein